MVANWLAPVGALVLVGCATTGDPFEAPAMPVFEGRQLPVCSYEVAGPITASPVVRGDRNVAESTIRRMLVQAAEELQANGIIGLTIQDAPHLPMADKQRGVDRANADLPAVTWHATATAIRFVDESCRS